MNRLIITALLLAMLLAGCASAGTAGEASGNGSDASSLTGGSEVTYYPTYDSSYKTARNDIFDFWFDIPSGWKALDTSPDGTSYKIVPDSGNATLMVYGTSFKGPEEDFYKQLAGGDGTVEDYTFNDQWVGRKIAETDSKVYYVRADGDTFICFSIDYKNDAGWYQENEDKLEHMAKSLRTRQGSFGNIGEGNSISMEDLQLGKLKLNVSYDQILIQMDQKPEREEASTDDGINAKTLFFKDGTEIYLVDGIVNSIDVISSSYATPRGLKVGDSSDRIEELYGKPDSKEKDSQWGYNYDGYELFTIFLKDGKVSEIEVDLVM